MKRTLWFFLVLLSLTIPSLASATDRTAASCSRTDVETQVTAAIQGDTIIIPDGTCAWTTRLTITKALSFRGLNPCTLDGNGRPTSCPTILQDNVPKGDSICANSNPMLSMTSTTDSGVSWSWSHFTIEGVATDPFVCVPGHWRVSSQSLSGRIHHLLFLSMKAPGIHMSGGGLVGVVDHNRFGTAGDAAHKVALYCSHEAWGGVGSFGDNSWAQPSSMGTGQALFLEDNELNDDASQGSGFIDGAHGCRAVIRHNLISYVGTHGTESTQRNRGFRQLEIYENTFTSQTNGDASASLIRSGTGVFHDNTLRCKSSNCTLHPYSGLIQFINYRDWDAYTPWGGITGVNGFDVNDPTVYFSGTNTSTTTNLLTDVTQSFGTLTTGDYLVRNVTKGWASSVSSNTATSITVVGGLFVAHTWSNGDSYQVRKAYPVLDQVGRGQGDLMTGNPPTEAWPNDALEPFYQWNNSFACPSGGSVCGGQPVNTIITTPIASSQSNHIQENRDYFNNTVMPGYSTYTYPHPLVSGQVRGPAASGGLRFTGGVRY
jgi:hypothetical protein